MSARRVIGWPDGQAPGPRGAPGETTAAPGSGNSCPAARELAAKGRAETMLLAPLTVQVYQRGERAAVLQPEPASGLAVGFAALVGRR
jgi:hypothetical protein